MTTGLRRLRWIAPPAILILAALLRLWALDRPDSLVFDELYYVRDAVSQLAHGYPTQWPEGDPAFGGERARAFLDAPAAIAHPPLGKWLIGLGILLFGPDSGWGWRCSAALAGVATVGVTMRLGWVLSRSMWVACFAGLLLALDGVHIVLSRVSMLDGFLTMFVALGALCIAHDWRSAASARSGRGALWRRPWLAAAGLAFGAAAAVKWSGLYPLAAFLVLLAIGDVLRRLGRARTVLRPRDEDHPARLSRVLWATAGRAAAAAAIALPCALAAYLSSWIGWIVMPGGQHRYPGEPWWVSLWQWHVDTFAWHATLSAQHPYQSGPLAWPLGLRPTAMYSKHWDGLTAIISPLPNPLITWGGVAALLLLAWIVLRGIVLARRAGGVAPLRSRAVTVSAFVLTGYLSGWLPWLLTVSRPAVYQFYSVVMTPFAALALALVLSSFASLPGSAWLLPRAGIRLHPSPEAVRGRRIAVLLLLCAALLLALLFWPLWIGMPVQNWFARLHVWLPGWA